MTKDTGEFVTVLRERIQTAASSALSPWADPENDDWRDAAADQVADAVLADLGVVEVESGRRWCPQHIGGWLNGDECENCRPCSVWVVLDSPTSDSARTVEP
jgi:hypothetical protein